MDAVKSPTALLTESAVSLAGGHCSLVRVSRSGDPAVEASFRCSGLLVAMLSRAEAYLVRAGWRRVR